MEEISYEGLTFKKYIIESDVEKYIRKTAEKINADYQGEQPVFLVILNGAIFFAADLMRHIRLDASLTCIKVASYQGTESISEVKTIIGLNEDLENKRVIIIEDIIDTGLTYRYLHDLLKERKVKDIRIAAMTFKEEAYRENLEVHYPALVIPNKFIIGKGLDYNGHGRHLKDIYQISQ